MDLRAFSTSCLPCCRFGAPGPGALSQLLQVLLNPPDLKRTNPMRKGYLADQLSSGRDSKSVPLLWQARARGIVLNFPASWNFAWLSLLLSRNVGGDKEQHHFLREYSTLWAPRSPGRLVRVLEVLCLSAPTLGGADGGGIDSCPNGIWSPEKGNALSSASPWFSFKQKGTNSKREPHPDIGRQAA